MRRFAAVLSFFVFSVSFAILVLPLAAACPVESPVPLRGLYLRSDVVVVGRVGAPGKWKLTPRTADSDDRYKLYLRSIPIRVEETIKGADAKNIAVIEERHEWHNNADDQPAIKVPNAIKEPEPEFESDLADKKDRRLFFLIKDEEGEGYREVYRNHPFEPTQKELDVFISRLRELGNIYSVAEPSKELIVEWLVSMAEDPLTRFEGAYELRAALEGANRAADEEAEEEEETADEEQKDSVQAEDAAPVAEGEGTAPSEEAETEQEGSLSPFVYRDYNGDPEFAKLLTAEQKERLVRAFLNVRFNYEAVKDEDAAEDDEGYVQVLNDADTELLGAVSALKDRRVIDRLLAELPSVARYQTWEASQMMDTIAGYFEDDKLDELVEKYSNVSWGGENDLIPDQEKAYDKPEAVETAGDNAVEVKAVTANSKDNAEAPEPKAQLPPKTYGQRRTELLDRIIALSSELVVTGKKE